MEGAGGAVDGEWWAQPPHHGHCQDPAHDGVGLGAEGDQEEDLRVGEPAEAEDPQPALLLPWRVCADGAACCPSQQRSCHSLDKSAAGRLNVSDDATPSALCT